MTKITNETRDKARELRQQGWRVIDIARELHVGKDAVSRWVKHIELTPEQITLLMQEDPTWAAKAKGAETNRIKACEQRLAYQQRGREKARQGSRLHMMGCMLYWGEGAKDRNNLDFVNSDKNMLILWMRFLREELQVPDDLVRIRIVTHSTNPEEKAHIGRYWCQTLALPESALEPVQTKIGAVVEKGHLEYGVCGVRVSRTEYVMHVFGAIQEYIGFDRPEWLF